MKLAPDCKLLAYFIPCIISPIVGQVIGQDPQMLVTTDWTNQEISVSKQFANGPLYDFNTPHDIRLSEREGQTGKQVDLFTWFPYYGSRYNYTVNSIHGYLAFANVLEDSLDFQVGADMTDWPHDPDPAMIAVYMCRQKHSDEVRKHQTGVKYRLLVRDDMILDTGSQSRTFSSKKRYTAYVDSTPQASELLDKMQQDLADGMVGAKSFRPDVALLVTWENTTYYQATSPEESEKTATYQVAFMTDRGGQLSYVILNYHELEFGGGDIYGSMKRGRCSALLSGGNQTGTVMVDPVYSKFPKQLSQVSSAPHKVRGRYLFRVDDIVRKGGCSNLTSGTYRLTMYPDIVNMLGDTTVQVNGPCFSRDDNPPDLNIGENNPSPCIIKNQAIAECRMRQFYQWGSKNVYLSYNQVKAYVGSIYYVPVGLDPFGLSVDNIASWFRNPPPLELVVRWYPGNFTGSHGELISSLKLSVFGYKEVKDAGSQKYVNTLKKLATVAVVSNTPDFSSSASMNQASTFYPQKSFTIKIPATLTWTNEGQDNLYSYSFGILKLEIGDSSQVPYIQRTQGIWSPPIPLHWLWLSEPSAGLSFPTDNEANRLRVADLAAKACLDWFEDDGKQWNFIQNTETSAPCPCRLNQAYADVGRFMPHPKCSQKLRNVGCDVYVGASECFLSAENIISNFATHYGQVGCYDKDGYLMQTTYASVQPDIVKGSERDPLPYSPGFPQRAYELGTPSFYKQYEAPTLSNYFHDVMPYYHCCKWAQNYCQFFYWRRPSSGCQEYKAPGIASVVGAGHFTTFDSAKFTFEGNGTYVYLTKEQDLLGPKVMVQLRLERYPDRFVDYSHRETKQEELVQPVDASVVTGVAIQEGSGEDTDRVLILCRKDTRRFKYRTSVLVNDEIRYFDTMKLQKYRGVTIYINDVAEGQSEIYVTLLNSHIGLKIRESFAYTVAQQQIYEESMGLMDVKVSVPSEYILVPDPITGKIDYRYAITGLVGTFSNSTTDEFYDPVSKVANQYTPNNDHTASQWARKWLVDGANFPNLFTLKNPDHKDWPESSLLSPIYKVAAYINDDHPFHPRYDSVFEKWYYDCMANVRSERCPARSVLDHVEQTCMKNRWCKYDFMTLQQKDLATRTLKEEQTDGLLRGDLNIGTNSCAAINIQYPEYLYIEPARGGYLHGENVQFQCYQNSWLKGDAYYKCRNGQWTKGSQPWCRDRELEETLRYLAIIFGILLSITLITLLFICCFCISKKRRDRRIASSAPSKAVKREILDPILQVEETKKEFMPEADFPSKKHEEYAAAPLRLQQSHSYYYQPHSGVTVMGSQNGGSPPSQLTFTSV